MKITKLLEENFSEGDFQVWSERPDHLHLFELKQTHSDKVILSSEFEGSQMEGDGIVYSYHELKAQNLVLGIKTADCLPILYLGANEVALVHAGWRGIHQKIHLNEKLVSIQPHSIFIGPCIHLNSFEVSEDFQAQFPGSLNFIKREGRFYFDLVSEAVSHMKNRFPKSKILSSNICTFENNHYNSFRRDKTKKRNFNVFVTRGINDNK